MGSKTMEQSFSIRGRTVRNRIGFAPMGCCVYTDASGCADEKSAELYRAAARGGTGLIVQGCAIVGENVRSKNIQLGIWSDAHIPGLRRIARAVHGEGALIICQLQHCGIRSALPHPPAPSAVTVDIGGKSVTAAEMSAADIERSIQLFEDAALRAVKAGYDGVELHASHGWLISTFLSRVTNRRGDEYGRDRLLYLRRTYERIRAAVPEDFIIGVRMSPYVPDLETGLAQVRAMDAMGFDYISVSVNYKIKFLEQDDTVPEDYAYDPMLYAAQEVKRLVHVPVFAAKGIRTGEMAARVLRDTDADMVLVGRGHLCDTDWAKKALAGEEPNRCLDCRGECVWRLGTLKCPSLALRAGGSGR